MSGLSAYAGEEDPWIYKDRAEMEPWEELMASFKNMIGSPEIVSYGLKIARDQNLDFFEALDKSQEVILELRREINGKYPLAPFDNFEAWEEGKRQWEQEYYTRLLALLRS